MKTENMFATGSLENIPDVLTTAPRVIARRQDELHQGEEAQEKEKDKFSKAIELFSKRVTLAGLEDVYKLEFLVEKCMWSAAFVLACIGIVMTSYNIFAEFAAAGPVYDDSPIFGEQAPFPNVTICLPEALNRTTLRQQLLIPYRVKEVMKRKNISLEAVINATLDIWHWDMKYVSYDDELLTKAAFRVIEATAQGHFFKTLFTAAPKCEDVLSDCYFEGSPFQCCQAARFLVFDGHFCFHISLTQASDLNETLGVTGGPMPDAIRVDRSGLSMNISIPSSLVVYNERVADNGVLLFLGQVGTIISAPTAVPFNADATVTMAPPKRVIDKNGCRLKGSQLQYFDYYDPYGINCIIDVFIGNLVRVTGCDVPFFDHMPASGTECSAQMVYKVLRTFFNSPYADGMHVDIRKYGAKYLSGIFLSKSDIIMSRYNYVFEVLSGNSIACQPLCSRWLYPITSASYGYMQNRRRHRWDDRDDDRSWSWLRIIFPEASYHRHFEKTSPREYTVICDIGGVMGVYLGVSGVTIIQFLIYGVYVCFEAYIVLKKRNSQVVNPIQFHLEHSQSSRM